MSVNSNCYGCSMTGIRRVAGFSPDCAIVLHSPKACGQIIREKDGYVLRRYTPGEHRPSPIYTSNISGKDAIFGAQEQLEECLVSVIQSCNPNYIFVGSSCVVGVIGDDVAAVCQKVSRQYNIPIFAIPCCGFMNGGYEAGMVSAARFLIDTFVSPGNTPQNEVILCGILDKTNNYEYEFIRNALALWNIKINAVFPGYTDIRQMQELNRARAILLCGSYTKIAEPYRAIANCLGRKLSIPVIATPDPIGWRQAARTFFQTIPFAEAPVDNRSINLVGVSDSLFNFANDKKEIASLLERGGIHAVNYIGSTMTLADLQRLRSAALNVVIVPELGKELAEFLYEEYRIPYLITLPPYGVAGSERWLLHVMEALHCTDSETEAVHSYFAAQKAELKTEAGKLRKIFGDLWISEINLAGPYSTVYGIAEALRTELSNYETMNLFVYNDGPDYLALANSEHYHCYRYFDPKLIGKSPDWILLSSSAEHALVVSQRTQTGNNFCCIAYPCFDSAVFQPYMGVNGCRNLLRFLWQFYIDNVRKAHP